jgi:hypothetical protein
MPMTQVVRGDVLMNDRISAFILKWSAAVNAFNHDELDPLTDLISDRCIFTSSGDVVGRGPDEIGTALKAGRAAGWTSHNPLLLTGAGEFVVGLYHNDMADGSTFIGAGIIRVDDSGQATEMVALEPEAVVAERRAQAAPN